MAAGDEHYGSGTTPRIHDTKRMLMVKELLATNAGGGGGTPGDPGTFISGAATDPNGVVTATGPARYVSETDHSDWFKPDGVGGNTGWLQLS